MNLLYFIKEQWENVTEIENVKMNLEGEGSCDYAY
jgi:hypothetical protein